MVKLIQQIQTSTKVGTVVAKRMFSMSSIISWIDIASPLDGYRSARYRLPF